MGIQSIMRDQTQCEILTAIVLPKMKIHKLFAYTCVVCSISSLLYAVIFSVKQNGVEHKK